MADEYVGWLELARHGDVTLRQHERDGTLALCGLYEADETVELDRDAWRWIAVCAAPLALQLLEPEPEPALGGSGPIPDPVVEPQQETLDLATGA